ncbi:hypothetical protein L1987_61873 [Smallanthus sonchifolius]|uniref:Uncharacterized protein n=1 Tax=Smallanthus sonchifolius TaxID=185202 RepID=A0ACB9C8T5_9ASTR|nr:hypothetical protein L1987_61873 [Smallanthus sonchifolius]
MRLRRNTEIEEAVPHSTFAQVTEPEIFRDNSKCGNTRIKNNRASDMAALAVKASVALDSKSKSRKMKKNKGRVSPLVLMVTTRIDVVVEEEDVNKVQRQNGGLRVTRSGSIRKTPRRYNSSKKGLLAVRSFKIRLSTIHENEGCDELQELKKLVGDLNVKEGGDITHVECESVTIGTAEAATMQAGQGYDLLHVKSVENEINDITELVKASGIKESFVGGLNLKEGLRMEDEGCEVTMLNQSINMRLGTLVNRLRNNRLEILALWKQLESKLLADGLNRNDTIRVESEPMTSVGTLVVAAMLAGQRYGRGILNDEGCEVTMLNELGNMILRTLLNEVRNSRLVLIKLLKELESKLLAGGLNLKEGSDTVHVESEPVTMQAGEGYDLLHVKSVENEVGDITELVEASGIKESSAGGLNVKEGGDTVHGESESVTSGGMVAVAAMPTTRRLGYGRWKYSQPEHQQVVGKGFGRAHVIRQQQQQVQCDGVVDHHVPRVDGPLSMYIENAKIVPTRRRRR